MLTKASEAFAVSQNSFNSEYRHDWMVMLTNESEKLADFVKVQALFFDDANVLLTTSEDYAYVWPGQTSPASGYDSLAVRAARMEVRVEASPRFSEVKTQLYPTVTESQIVRERFSTKVVGKATSPWTTTVENLSVVCVLRDSGGGFVGVESSFLDLFPGGVTAVVECPYLLSSAADAAVTAEMYLVLSSLSKVIE